MNNHSSSRQSHPGCSSPPAPTWATMGQERHKQISTQEVSSPWGALLLLAYSSALTSPQPALHLTCPCLLNRRLHSGWPEWPNKPRREARNWCAHSVLRTGVGLLRRKPKARKGEQCLHCSAPLTEDSHTKSLQRKQGRKEGPHSGSPDILRSKRGLPHREMKGVGSLRNNWVNDARGSKGHGAGGSFKFLSSPLLTGCLLTGPLPGGRPLDCLLMVSAPRSPACLSDPCLSGNRKQHLSAAGRM